MDLRELGLWVKSGNWRAGLLVARNVEKDRGNPARQNSDTSDNKVSAREAARIAGISVMKILRLLEAWDDAAADGVRGIRPSSELYPGKEVKLDVDKLPPWENYYKPVIEKRGQKRASTSPRPMPSSSSGKQYIGPDSEVGWNPLYCAPNRTAPEFIRLIAADLSKILSPLPEGYHLNATDLERLRDILALALERAEAYTPLTSGESKGKAQQAVDKLPN